MDIALETKVISKFMHPSKRERYIDFCQKNTTRRKFIDELSRSQTFQNDLFEKIDESESEIIKRIAAKFGINDCYIISENAKIDGQRMGIDDALKLAISPWSDTTTLIVLGDAQLIYREHDGVKNKWISKIK